MILSYNALMQRVVDPLVIYRVKAEGKRELRLPIDDSQVNSASIDLTLGTKLLVERPQHAVLSLSTRDPMICTEVDLTDGEPFYLQPGQFVLAHTAEYFNFPNDISADYCTKSSMARIGLEHLSAGWCDAGWHGSVLTLELKNMSEFHTIALRAGDPIGQLRFFQHEPVPEHASYAKRGRYNNDTTVSGIKP